MSSADWANPLLFIWTCLEINCISFLSPLSRVSVNVFLFCAPREALQRDIKSHLHSSFALLYTYPSSRDSREQLMNYVDLALMWASLPSLPPHLLFMFIVFLSARRSERILTGQVARLVKSQIKIEQTLNWKRREEGRKSFKKSPRCEPILNWFRSALRVAYFNCKNIKKTRSMLLEIGFNTFHLVEMRRSNKSV